jgi:RNA-directed DNA polymerase
MKRSSITLADIAEWHNLTAAAYRAAVGKRHRPEVRAFFGRLEENLAELHRQIREDTIRVGVTVCFQIHDPKLRIIHAPCFRERVLHHAVIAQVGPVLDRALVFDTYACRIGKGSLAAVQRCQQHSRRFPWYAKIDMRSYFPSIDHAVLEELLTRRFKDPGLLHLLARLIDSHHDAPGRGLPIGALTSQHFANWYLDGLDRLLLEQCRVAGMIRYMDDVVWWCPSRERVRDVLDTARGFLRDRLRLEVKRTVQVHRSAQGLRVCGYRVLPGTILLSSRRRRRYAQARRRWEEAYARGEIDGLQLQAGYSSALAITAHADAAAWRREQLRRCPPDPSCES